MSIKITGLENLLARVGDLYGKENIRRVEDIALRAGAKVIYDELQVEFWKFYDQKGSLDEMTIGDPFDGPNGTRTIAIKWEGPLGRYRIIHLNELGTITNPNPRGKGAIARALANGRAEYRRVLKRTIEGAL